jgi:hypothetical protein
MFGELSHFAFGHAQNFGYFRKCAASLKCRESAYHRAMFPAVLLENELHYVVFAVVGEINVYVRQFVERHAVFVQEPAKIEIKTNGANATDAKAITNQRVRRASACNPVDATFPAVLQKFPSCVRQGRC